MAWETWFKLKYRDSSLRKYTIDISKLDCRRVGMDADLVNINILLGEKTVCRFHIKFTDIWLIQNKIEKDKIEAALAAGARSPFIEFLLRDYIFGKDPAELHEKHICFNSRDDKYTPKVFRNKNGILN